MPRPGARIAATLAITVLLAGSVWYASGKPGSARDYKGLVREMRPYMQPEDMVFIRRRNWADTPLFYYLRNIHYVADNFELALARNPERRVWLVTWPKPGFRIMNERRKALVEQFCRTIMIKA